MSPACTCHAPRPLTLRAGPPGNVLLFSLSYLFCYFLSPVPDQCPSCAATLRRFNELLPPDVALVRVRKAPPLFDAQRSSSGKIYHYFINDSWEHDPMARPYSLWVRPLWCAHTRSNYSGCLTLDVGAMADAAARMRGRHDFRMLVGDGRGRHMQMPRGAQCPYPPPRPCPCPCASANARPWSSIDR